MRPHGVTSLWKAQVTFVCTSCTDAFWAVHIISPEQLPQHLWCTLEGFGAVFKKLIFNLKPGHVSCQSSVKLQLYGLNLLQLHVNKSLSLLQFFCSYSKLAQPFFKELLFIRQILVSGLRLMTSVNGRRNVCPKNKLVQMS